MRDKNPIRAKEGQMMTIQQLVEVYLRAGRLEGKTAATLKWYVRRLNQFVRFLVSRQHSMSVRDLKAEDAEEYIAQLMEQEQKWVNHPNQKAKKGKLSMYTIHGHVRALRALGSWTHQQGYLPEDPFFNLPIPKLPKLLYPTFTPDEIEQILDCAESISTRSMRARTMLRVLFETAIRAEELISLKLENFDQRNGTLKVFGKGQKERIVPVGDSTQRELLAYINFHRPQPVEPAITNLFLTEDGTPFTYSGLSSVIWRIRQKTGIQKLHMHLCRHTSLTMMATNGMNAFGIQQVAGHSSIKTTEIYVHLSDQQSASKYRTFSVMDRMEQARSDGMSKRGPRRRRNQSEATS